MLDAQLPLALLLEDEPFIAMVVEQTLADLGFGTVAFGSCAEATAWLTDGLPVVVIMDINLVDGPCTDIAMLLRDREVPFIVHSGYLQAEAPHPIFEEGIWVSKPGSPGELAKALKVALSAAD